MLYARYVWACTWQWPDTAVREETDWGGEGWHTQLDIFVVLKVMPFVFMPWLSDECTMFSICDTGRPSLPCRGPSAWNSPDRLI